ncbi:MAG: DNA helicase UvrD, partial [Pseudodesulfovibrio sp.]
MERFTADLHIHSRFSRATSKNLTIRNLAAWGRLKGLNVLGTGDFTHPEWLAEIEEQLTDNGKGLFVLRDTSGLEKEIPTFEGEIPGRTRFMLQTEISSIYKRGGKVRKVHNLVYMPDLDSAKRFNEKLGQVGNLASDGRPILGLDCRDLIDMVL